MLQIIYDDTNCKLLLAVSYNFLFVAPLGSCVLKRLQETTAKSVLGHSGLQTCTTSQFSSKFSIREKYLSRALPKDKRREEGGAGLNYTETIRAISAVSEGFYLDGILSRVAVLHPSAPFINTSARLTAGSRSTMRRYLHYNSTLYGIVKRTINKQGSIEFPDLYYSTSS